MSRRGPVTISKLKTVQERLTELLYLQLVSICWEYIR